ncbi:MAG: hypothetical protein IPM84_22360 [Anaerolineae bacterium]|nr:hypothetical protein [Anaerolineae bacterium]
MKDLDRMDSQWVEMVASKPAHVLFRGGAERLVLLVTIAVMAVTFMAITALAPMPAAGSHNGRAEISTPAVSRAFFPHVPHQPTPTPTPTSTPTPLIELVGQIGGFIRAVEAQGGYAYVGVGPRLLILNVSNPSHPVLVGQSPVLPTFVKSVSVVGDFAYVTKGYGGLHIIDVSDPANPTLRGAYDTPGPACGISVVGSLAYVADGGAACRSLTSATRPTPCSAAVMTRPDMPTASA